jgi:hypothetical protein
MKIHVCNAITIESQKEIWDAEIGGWSSIKVTDTQTKEVLSEGGDDLKIVNPQGFDLHIEANMDGSLTLHGVQFEVEISYHNTTTIKIY